MIDARELRIGNWVNEEVLGNAQVAGILSNTTWLEVNNLNKQKIIVPYQYHITNLHIDPIPLTTEILEKCGFTERTPDSENVNSWRLHDTNVILNQYKSDTSYYYLYPALWYPTRHIKYLHEVQNTTYYLTEIELEIKL